MYTIISFLIDGVLTAVLIVPVIWGWQRLFHKNSRGKHRWLVVLFGYCIAGIFMVTGIPSIGRLSADLSINLIPFDGLFAGPVQYCLNIVLFLPVGIIAPLIWKKFGRLKNIIALGGGLSCLIEFMQLFNFRATDIDDLIANTAGAVIGFVLVKTAAGSQIERVESAGQKEGIEALMLCALVFLVNFTVQPILSDLVWSAIV